jgi:nicotinate-nucleotide adenylyltransferase
MAKRIGLYGGTFDPIHYGHINLALEIKEKCNLSEVWFIPASVSPLRKNESVSSMHRYRMVSLGIESIIDFYTRQDEILREGISYTIDTVRSLLSLYPSDSFFLLLGEDVLFEFPLWREHQELIKLIPILIGCRHGSELKKKISTLSFNPLLKEAILGGLVESDLMDISATRVRERLKKRLYCGHLVPPKVLDYIYENQLYFLS